MPCSELLPLWAIPQNPLLCSGAGCIPSCAVSPSAVSFQDSSPANSSASSQPPRPPSSLLLPSSHRSPFQVTHSQVTLVQIVVRGQVFCLASTTPQSLRIHAGCTPVPLHSTSNPGLEVLWRGTGVHPAWIRRDQGEEPQDQRQPDSHRSPPAGRPNSGGKPSRRDGTSHSPLPRA